MTTPTATLLDTKFRSCHWACGVTVWCEKSRVCDTCRDVISALTGGGGLRHGGDVAKGEREKRIERYTRLAANKMPLVAADDQRAAVEEADR